MAGTVAVVSSRIARLAVNKYVVSWTADASGVVSVGTVTLGDGWIQQVKFIPAVSPGTPPTGGYKFTLIDSDGVDVLIALGNGASGLSATVKQVGCPLLHDTFEATGANPCMKVYLDGGDYIPTVSGSGNAGQGSVAIYISDQS